MSEMVLEVRGLEAAYGRSPVLFGVDLEVRQGEVRSLLGRNGMGKSSLIKCLVGWLKPTAGRIRLCGEDVTGWAPERLARQGLALVPEGRQIFPNLSVEENLVAFAANRRGLAEPWTLGRVYEAFPRLAERRHHGGAQLSGGEQQLLAIARALMTNPQLLILDEATEGLAPLVREEIWRVLDQLRARGQTILVVDKYVQRLVRLGDAHHIMERGRVVWQGDSPALEADPGLWERHLGV